MRIESNDTFRQRLVEYNLSRDLSFSVDLPPEVLEILGDEIIFNDLGITLKSFRGLHRATESWENQSWEEYENHFHVDWLIDPQESREVFKLGVRTLILLAEKFMKDNRQGIRFPFSFQTPELGKQFAETNKIGDDEHFISDRLSFYTIRENEEVVNIH
jgi:hypothetical protein